MLNGFQLQCPFKLYLKDHCYFSFILDMLKILQLILCSQLLAVYMSKAEFPYHHLVRQSFQKISSQDKPIGHQYQNHIV